MQSRFMAVKCITFLGIVSVNVYAQTGSGSITGVVRDATQSAVPAASIRITNTDSGVALTAITNDEGIYRVNSVGPGTYRVEASAPGFDTTLRTDVVLTTAQTVAVDLTLQLGKQNQTIN